MTLTQAGLILGATILTTLTVSALWTLMGAKSAELHARAVAHLADAGQVELVDDDADEE